MSKHAESKYIQYMCYKQTVNQYTPSHVIPPRLSHPVWHHHSVLQYVHYCTIHLIRTQVSSVRWDGKSLISRTALPVRTEGAPLATHWGGKVAGLLSHNRPPLAQTVCWGSVGVCPFYFKILKWQRRKICCNHNNPRTELIHLVK